MFYSSPMESHLLSLSPSVKPIRQIRFFVLSNRELFRNHFDFFGRLDFDSITKCWLGFSDKKKAGEWCWAKPQAAYTFDMRLYVFP